MFSSHSLQSKLSFESYILIATWKCLCLKWQFILITYSQLPRSQKVTSLHPGTADGLFVTSLSKFPFLVQMSVNMTIGDYS